MVERISFTLLFFVFITLFIPADKFLVPPLLYLCNRFYT